jgi:hypothetical protein
MNCTNSNNCEEGGGRGEGSNKKENLYATLDAKKKKGGLIDLSNKKTRISCYSNQRNDYD